MAALGIASAGGAAAAALSCSDRAAPSAAASRAAATKFAHLYRVWHKESNRIRFSSNTNDYVALPAYQAIVDLGVPALPALERKLVENRNSDFMLARAVVAICGWDRQAFAADSEQVFRDKVLRKLRSAE